MFTIRGIYDGNRVRLLEPVSVAPNIEVMVTFLDKNIGPASRLEEVAGSLRYYGKAKSLEEMDEAIAVGVRNHNV